MRYLVLRMNAVDQDDNEVTKSFDGVYIDTLASFECENTAIEFVRKDPSLILIDCLHSRLINSPCQYLEK